MPAEAPLVAGVVSGSPRSATRRRASPRGAESGDPPVRSATHALRVATGGAAHPRCGEERRPVRGQGPALKRERWLPAEDGEQR
jgi:hypothetical protein